MRIITSVEELGLLCISVSEIVIRHECFDIGIWHQVFRKWVHHECYRIGIIRYECCD